MKRLLRCLIVILCLCLLLSVCSMAAESGKFTVLKQADILLSLPENIRLLRSEEAEAVLNPDAFSALMLTMMEESGLRADGCSFETLAGFADGEEGDIPEFTGLLLKAVGFPATDLVDFSELEEDEVLQYNAVYNALGEAMATENMDVTAGMWKNQQTYYFRMAYALTTDGSTQWVDLYETVYHGNVYFCIFQTSQKELFRTGQTIMKKLILERHSFYPGGFPDLEGHWAAEDAEKAVEAGLFKGSTSTEFAPDSPMTRAMLVQVLYRMAGSPEAQSSKFSDVAVDAWYAKAVAWASENGIVKGAGGKFDPDGLLTREQLAAILWRYAKYEGRDVSAEADLRTYKDAEEVSSYAIAPLQWACGEGLIKGASHRLMPRSTTTRAQVAAILVRYVPV